MLKKYESGPGPPIRVKYFINFFCFIAARGSFINISTYMPLYILFNMISLNLFSSKLVAEKKVIFLLPNYWRHHGKRENTIEQGRLDNGKQSGLNFWAMFYKYQFIFWAFKKHYVFSTLINLDKLPIKEKNDT